MMAPDRRVFFLADDGMRDGHVTGVQTCAVPIYAELNELKKRFVANGAAAPAEQYVAHAENAEMRSEERRGGEGGRCGQAAAECKWGARVDTGGEGGGREDYCVECRRKDYGVRQG